MTLVSVTGHRDRRRGAGFDPVSQPVAGAGATAGPVVRRRRYLRLPRARGGSLPKVHMPVLARLRPSLAARLSSSPPGGVKLPAGSQATTESWAQAWRASELLATMTGQDLDRTQPGASQGPARRGRPKQVHVHHQPARPATATDKPSQLNSYKGHVPADPDSEIVTAQPMTGNSGSLRPPRA